MAKKPQFRGGYGGVNMNQQANLMRQAQKMQEELLKAQEELEKANYTAQAGGGVVTATVSGKHELVSMEIKPEAVDPDDVEMLQDLIVAAVNAANKMVETASAESMQKISGGMPNIPGLGL